MRGMVSTILYTFETLDDGDDARNECKLAVLDVASL